MKNHRKGRDFLRTYLRFCVVLMILALLSCVLPACEEAGDPVTYSEVEHTHTYGHWYDAAPETEGAPVTREVRYCKICHAEDVREKK